MDGWNGGPARGRRRHWLAIVLTVLIGLVAAGAAQAAGYYLPMRGVRPLGRGGAAAVSGGGLHAMWYNPAALAAEAGSRLLVDLSLADLDTLFQRTPRQEPNGDVVEFDPVSNEASPMIIPNIYFASDFGVDRLAVGLGLAAPYGALYTYPTNGPQRYTAIQNAESFFFHISTTVAYEVTDWFRVGASFQALFLHSVVTVMASAYEGPFGQPEDEDLDILMRIESVDPFTPTGNLGFWFQPVEGLELGIAGQLGTHVQDDSATLRIRLPSNPIFDGASVEGTTVSGGFDLAPMIRFGVRWVHDRGDLELNAQWEGWSVHDAIETTPDDLVIRGVFAIDELVVGPLTIDMNWQDTWAVAFGGDFVAVPERLVVRAGVAWEQSAIPDSNISTFQLDLDKIAPTLGLSVLVPEANLTIDAGYAHFFFMSRDVDDSQVRQINPTFEEGAVIVGNGHYQGNVDLFGIGAEVHF